MALEDDVPPWSASTFNHGMRRARNRLLDWLAPPRCFGCDAWVEASARPACPRCLGQLEPVETPLCFVCGASARLSPSGEFPGGGDLCAACVSARPAYATARARWLWEPPLSQAWGRVKYGRDLGLLRDIAALSAPWARAQLTRWRDDHGPLYITPVPMRRRALARRGFNQSAVLARLWLGAGLEGVAWEDRLARKRRRTRQQAGLGEAARRENVLGAFEADPSRARDRTVVFVDDVLTTGATADALARAALGAGAQRVLALTLARAMSA